MTGVDAGAGAVADGRARSAYVLERAWVDGAVHDGVRVEIEGGRFTRVELPRDSSRFTGTATPGKRGDTRCTGYSDTPQAPDTPPTPATPGPGLTLPGLANGHSHAFHRALRGRTQRERGTFWTWRDQMYDVAARLDPDSYFTLARAAYREMLAGGITSVGEFHYLHHRPDGTPYADPNAMGLALLAAAEEAGIRLVLLDSCYLSSGFGAPVEGAQVRYTDGTAAAWAERAGRVTTGASIHSVRAVPREELGEFRGRGPLHVHLSEQVAENEACLAAYGLTPTALLHAEGLLGPATTVVHATHLTDADIAMLGESGTHVCFCPTTERDLGDGIGPGRALHEAGARLTLGSDSHAVVDLFEEMRALELDERLATQQRGHWTAAELLATGTAHGSLGLDDVGAIAVGQRADLVTLDTASARTAGTGADEHTAVFAATAEDVTQVVVDGRLVVRRDDRAAIGRELAAAIDSLWTPTEDA